MSDGIPVPIGQKGGAILRALLRAPGEIVTKSELLDAAWPGSVVEESNLSVQVAALRKFLGRTSENAEWIVTIPRVGYRFGSEVAIDDGHGPQRALVEPSDPGRKPSIAVLPFSSLGESPEQEYFADGIAEDIINALSRHRWFFIIGRNSSFIFKRRAVEIGEVARELDVDYVIGGSVRKSGDHIRVSAHLVDARSAHQLWADRYDVQLAEAFVIQDRVAEQVAGAIEPELLQMESVVAARRRNVGDATATYLVYQGTWFFHQITRATHKRARELFRQAREMDQNSPEACIWLARVDAGLIAYGWSEDVSGDVSEGLEAALTAVQIDERNPYAHYALAIVSLYGGMRDQAVRAAGEACELSPSFALAHLVLGMAHLFSGSASQAIVPLAHGLRLNPHDPQNFVWYNALALAYLFANDASTARDVALKGLTVRPAWRSTLETLACCYAELGDLHAARWCVEQIATAPPSCSDPFLPLKQQNPRWGEELDALLMRAGRKEAQKPVSPRRQI